MHPGVQGDIGRAESLAFYRTDALILLGGATDDWHEGQRLLDEAESRWRHLRIIWPEDSTDNGTNGSLAELRVGLDKLVEVQCEDAPKDALMSESDTALQAAEALSKDMAVSRVAPDSKDGLTELERKDTEEADRLWEEKFAMADPATPGWMWSGATTPPPGYPRRSSTPKTWPKRQPGQSEDDYLSTVDPRMPASEWEFDGKWDMNVASRSGHDAAESLG